MGTIGENIKLARKKLGLSQAQLAEMSKITTAAVSRYEAGLRVPRVEHLRSIANALDVTVGFLEGYEPINAKQLQDAMLERNPQRIEELLNLQPGSVKFYSEEEEQSLIKEFDEIQRIRRTEIDQLLKRLSVLLKFSFPDLNDQEFETIAKLIRPFSKLNDEGQQKAVERVEELTEIPKYKK